MMTVYEGDIYVSSPYGWRISPITGQREHHNGKDMVGRQSKRQRMVGKSGTCVLAQYDRWRGYNVVIRLEDDPRGEVRLRYQHQQALMLKVGSRVTLGQVVGIEGSSGDSTGSHCHFEVTVNGQAVDPSPWDGLPNKAGLYKSTNPTKEETTMLDVFTATTGSLELFSSPDVNATIPAGGGTLRLPAGVYAIHQSGPLANSTLDGVRLRCADGTLGWAAKLAGKYTLGQMPLTEAEEKGLVGRGAAPALPAGLADSARALLASCTAATRQAEALAGLVEG